MDKQKLESFAEQLQKVIDYHVSEYDFSYEEVIGGLEILKLSIYDELNVEIAEDSDEDEEDEDKED